MRVRPLFLLLPLLGMSCAMAHDLWLERDGRGPALVLLQGHKHSAHAGAQTLPYPSGFVKDARCQADDATIRALPTAGPVPWAGGGECAVLRLAVSSGYWSKTPWETTNQSKDKVPGAIKSWLSEESLKRIERWTPVAAQPLSDGLEITPVTNPLRLSPGDKLTVRITDKRRPLAGVPVAYGGDTRGVTGADGTIAIRIRHGGVNLISASVETPLTDGRADVHIHTATLQFDLSS